jgi:hypothetical protein
MPLNSRRICFQGQNFNTLLKFQEIHQNTPFYNNIKQYIHLLLKIYEFQAIIFYIFMLLIHNVLLNNG